MTTTDHNKTLARIHLAIGMLFASGLVASPWIIAKNFRHEEQIPSAMIVFGLVFLLALLMFSTAIIMLKQKPIGRTMTLFSAVPLTNHILAGRCLQLVVHA